MDTDAEVSCEVMETWTSGTGQKLFVHNRSKCAGQVCTIHNVSDHHMKDWPQHWRQDRGIMERLCEHGVGHPDPDDIMVKKYGNVHGCCGCCTIQKKELDWTDINWSGS